MRNRRPYYIRWMLDVDYYKKLSKKEKIWLGAFLAEYYGETSINEHSIHSVGHKKQCNRTKNAQQSDAMNVADFGKIDDE